MIRINGLQTLTFVFSGRSEAPRSVAPELHIESSAKVD